MNVDPQGGYLGLAQWTERYPEQAHVKSSERQPGDVHRQG